MNINVDESWKKENGQYCCPNCGKEFSKKGISTHIWRMHGDGMQHKPTLNKKLGKSWNSGLTKASHPSILSMSEKAKQSGNKWRGRHHTEESKTKTF